MANKKYYGILQEKVKDSKGDTIIKEYVYDAEGKAPLFAKRDIQEYARENGLKLVLFCAYH